MLYKELDASLEAFVKNIILLENTGELGLWNVCKLDYEIITNTCVFPIVMFKP